MLGLLRMQGWDSSKFGWYFGMFQGKYNSQTRRNQKNTPTIKMTNNKQMGPHIASKVVHQAKAEPGDHTQEGRSYEVEQWRQVQRWSTAETATK